MAFVYLLYIHNRYFLFQTYHPFEWFIQWALSPERTRGLLPSANPAACPVLLLSGTGQANPATIQLLQALQGLEHRQTVLVWRGQSHWRIVLPPVPPSGTGQCGCRGSWVRRDGHKCSPLCSSNKKDRHYWRLDRQIRTIAYLPSVRLPLMVSQYLGCAGLDIFFLAGEYLGNYRNYQRRCCKLNRNNSANDFSIFMPIAISPSSPWKNSSCGATGWIMIAFITSSSAFPASPFAPLGQDTYL